MEIKSLSDQKHIENALLRDYLVWLEGYLLDGGEPSHYYDYPWIRCRMKITWEDFTTNGECGASSQQTIAPYGISYLGGPIGHNTIYYYDEFRDKYCVHGHFVPVYSDPEFNEIRLLQEFIRNGAEERNWIEWAESRSDLYPYDSRW